MCASIRLTPFVCVCSVGTTDPIAVCSILKNLGKPHEPFLNNPYNPNNPNNNH